MIVDWATFKAFISARNLSIQYVDLYNKYYLYAYDGPFPMECTIIKKDTPDTDQSEFEASYKSAGNKSYSDADGIELSRLRAFANSDGFRFRGKGISGTATKNTTSNIDYKLTEERYINGCNLILKNHAFGDSVKFQVIDIDNVIGYGNNVVLDEFGTDWYIAEDAQNQGVILLPYPAKILANLYIRIVYNSVGILLNVSVKCNLFLHKKV